MMSWPNWMTRWPNCSYVIREQIRERRKDEPHHAAAIAAATTPPAGRRQLEVEHASWKRASLAINEIMAARWALVGA